MRKAKKLMSRQERKDYKKAQRANLESGYVMVTRETPKNPKNVYTKLVTRAKAYEMVAGKIDIFGERKPYLKHKWVQAEVQ